VAALLALACSHGHAASISFDATAPTVDGKDIANYGAATGTEKWWVSSDGTGYPKGQTFTTGLGATRLTGVSYQIADTQKAEPTKTYVIRVGTVYGSTFTEVYSETVTQTSTWNAAEYATWSFDTPPLLYGNMTYGVDVGLTSSSSAWQTGIPYIKVTGEEYAGGSRYAAELSNSVPGVGSSSMVFQSGDRVFHLDLEKPTAAGFELVAGSPPDDTTNALVPEVLVGTFSRDLAEGTGDITLRNLTDAIDTVIPVGDAQITLSENLLIIEPSTPLLWGTAYAVQIDAGAIEDTSSNPFGGISDDTTWNFTTRAVDPLLDAVAELKDHINGVTNLSSAQIEAHKLTIDNEKTRFDDRATNVTAVLDLVTTYDNVEGPIWVSGSTAAGGFNRGSVSDGDIHWVIYTVMQYIMDEIYNQPTSIASYESLLDGYTFGCHVDFPGPVTDSVVPGETNSATISASFPDTFGRDTQQWTLPARKPTGCYLPAGEIATVIVPPALVDQGYKVRVGAHSWNLENRPPVQRLERCTVLYNIESNATEVASPLGGGIYIEVPMGATGGVVNVEVTGAVRSPYFSYKSIHTTTSNEWVTTERGLGAPWADFQSDKYMMQVPTMWIYALDDPESLMADWDAAIDVQNDLMGFPHLRGKETMYCQVDVIMRSSVHAPGYPAINQTDGSPASDDTGGYAGSYLVRGPQRYQGIPETEIHEQGHAYFFPKFGGETEVEVNLPYVAVLNQAFGYDLSFSLAASRGYEGNTNRTLDNTAVTWMTVFNFSPRDTEMASGEKAYQMKGHAKFVDIARLFGWEGMGRFWYYYNSNDTYNISYSTDDDSKLIQLCKSVGYDIRPLFHFWGTHPGNPSTVADAIVAEGLIAPVEIRDLLLYYKSLIPDDNAAFQTFAFNWWNKQPSIGGYWTEREHSRQWDDEALFGEGDQQRADITSNEMYIAACATQVRERVQEIIDLYEPPGVAVLAPPDTATGVPLGTNLVVTFDEAIVAVAGNITISNLTEGTSVSIAVTNAAQVTIAGSNMTINPATDLEKADDYAVLIDPGAIRDADGNLFRGVLDTTTWSFTAWTDVPTVNFSPATASYPESSTSATGTVVLSQVHGDTVTVEHRLATPSGSATSPADYTYTPDTLVFAPGETNKDFTFTVVNDTDQEGEETIVFELGTISNGLTGTADTFTYTIEQDTADIPPTVGFAPLAVSYPESILSATGTVVLSHAYSGIVTVSLAIVSGTATEDEDYTYTPGTLVFAAGETNKDFTFVVIDDIEEDGDETVIFEFSSIVNGTAGTASNFTYTIGEDTNDWHVLPFSEPFDALTEGDLDTQHGWIGDSAEVQTGVTFSASAAAGGFTGNGSMRHTFTDAKTGVWTDMQLKVVYRDEEPVPPADMTVVVYVWTNGQVMVFDGGSAVYSGVKVPEGEWARFTVYSDYSAGEWDLYVNADHVGHYDFFDQTAASYRECGVYGGRTTYVDAIGITTEPPSLRPRGALFMFR